MQVKNALQILQAASAELGVQTYDVYVGNLALGAKQWLQLLNAAGQELLGEHDWQALIQRYTFNTVAGVASYAMPTGFESFIDETQWNNTQRWPLDGPRTQERWAMVEGYGINIGPYYGQQLRNGLLQLQPTPASVQAISFYYASNLWVDVGGDEPPSVPFVVGNSTSVTNDAARFAFDDRLLELSVKWRWLRAKRLSYDEEKAEYDSALRVQMGVDRGARTLSMDPARESGNATGIIVPITGFGA